MELLTCKETNFLVRDPVLPNSIITGCKTEKEALIKYKNYLNKLSIFKEARLKFYKSYKPITVRKLYNSYPGINKDLIYKIESPLHIEIGNGHFQGSLKISNKNVGVSDIKTDIDTYYNII